MKNTIKVALVGNPNVGKTSIFNALTGLNQHVGNYPGITVERKTGNFSVSQNINAHIIDVPGTYSIQPTSKDEEIALRILFDKKHKDYPDVVVVVVDIDNIKRNLLLFSQIKDLEIPTILAINMADQMQRKGIEIDIPRLEQLLGTKIALVSARKNQGIDELKQLILEYKEQEVQAFFDLKQVDETYFSQLQKANSTQNLFISWMLQTENPSALDLDYVLNKQETYPSIDLKKMQHRETVKRYQKIGEILNETYVKNKSKATGFEHKLDQLLIHPILGYLIFFVVIFVIFQSVFEWSSIPMDFIDEEFSKLSNFLKNQLTPGMLTDLVTEGIIPGISGVLIFIPQIAILFFFISILEETGYMSRVVFLMDRIMRPFGLSGKSVVPLMSGTACAIPAIMSARNIESYKERLITILITPFTTCSARIPIYIVIISLVIPDHKIAGLFSLQAMVMTVMYMLGFFMALLAAYILKQVIKNERKSHFIIEMPTYKMPLWKNVGYTVVEKTKAFVFGAGKIILMLSVILWFLGSHGPAKTFGKAEEIIAEKHQFENLSEAELEDKIAAYQLETSYIGMIGNTIQPVFQPLGYDWKISIAVLTSFAAREVFVGNLATLYNIGSKGEETETVVSKMRNEKNLDGTPVFNLAVGVSLLLFYAFAMQCISTFAIARKETNSWKWTISQTLFMTGIAYFTAFVAYQILS